MKIPPVETEEFVRQMPGFNSQSLGTVRTLKLVVIVLCYRLYSCDVVIVLLLFGVITLHVSDAVCVHHQEYYKL